MEHGENCEAKDILKDIEARGRVSRVEREHLLSSGKLCFCAERLAAWRNRRPLIVSEGMRDRKRERAVGELIALRMRQSMAGNLDAGLGERLVGEGQLGEETGEGKVLRVDFRNRRRLW